MKEKILNRLKELTYNRKNNLIKEILNSTNKEIKGKIFEEYLAFLFEGNGFIATVNGGSWDGGADIVLSKPSNPNKVEWIVQAKNTIKPLGNSNIAEELIKFEKESGIKYNCKYFMIISLNGYVENISIFNKTNMILESFDYIEELINNYSNVADNNILLPDLRPHNRYTYKEIKAILEDNNRVAVPNATGTGKSFIILQLLFDYIKASSIVLAPTNEIIDRLKRIAPWSVKSCNFYTYSKFSSLYAQGKLNDVSIDMLILDELHRAGALNWGKAVKYILNNNPKAKVVGLSATPIRFLDNNRDMINELMDGNSTTPISLSDAIVRNILPMPVYVSAMYNFDKEMKKKLNLMKKLNLSMEDRNRFLNELNMYKKNWENENKVENVIKKHLPKKNKLKFIVFCENNKHLKEMKSEVISWFENILQDNLKVSSYVVTSESKRNNEVLYSFENNNYENEVKLLFAISKLNEGIHIKNINGIIMLRNTKSPTIYYQQLGRCLTADCINEKPVVFDFVDNIDNLELVNFRIQLEDAVRANNSYRKSIGLTDEEIRFFLYQEHQDVILKLKNIEKKITYNWEKSFDSLIKFKEINGHINVPKTLEYSRLYSWVSLQRTLYNKQILNEEFIKKLDNIGFIWDVRFNNYRENYLNYCSLIADSYDKVISHYRIISAKYYIPIYEYESLICKYDKGSSIPTKQSIIRWMDKQLNDFQNGNLDNKKSELIKLELREVQRFTENMWMESVYKIISFYRYIEKTYKIDCYLNKIAPDKNNFINKVVEIYGNKKIIKNTIEKLLPREAKEGSSKYINDEVFNRQLVIHLLENDELGVDKSAFIDNLNNIYFNDMIKKFHEINMFDKQY